MLPAAQELSSELAQESHATRRVLERIPTPTSTGSRTRSR